MQPYHNGDHSYHSQYTQPPASYYPQYIPYPPYLPPQQPVTAPFPAYAPQYEPQSQYPTPGPRRRKLERSASVATAGSVPSRPSTPAGPLKSAMKKRKSLDRAASTGTVSLSRQRTTSESRQRVNSLTRPRTNSSPASAFVPDHLFLSLYSGNELRIDNIAYQATLDDLRESVLPMWPHGVSLEDSRGDSWRIRFGGSPWTCVGTDGILAQRLICRLFMVLARQGYSYLTTVQTSHSPRPPRLVFVDSIPDVDVQIFTATISQSKLKLTLLDAPPDITLQLTQQLRSVFPRKISSHGANEDGIHIIEVRKEGFRSREGDRSLFTACMLRYFNSAGYKLDGSVPLGKTGPLGLGSRNEAWVFRSVERRQEVRIKQ